MNEGRGRESFLEQGAANGKRKTPAEIVLDSHFLSDSMELKTGEEKKKKRSQVREALRTPNLGTKRYHTDSRQCHSSAVMADLATVCTSQGSSAGLGFTHCCIPSTFWTE